MEITDGLSVNEHPACVKILYYLDDMGWSVVTTMPPSNHYLKLKSIEMLEEAGFIELTSVWKGNARKGYRLSPKGKKFLKKYDEFKAEFGI